MTSRFVLFLQNNLFLWFLGKFAQWTILIRKEKGADMMIWNMTNKKDVERARRQAKWPFFAFCNFCAVTSLLRMLWWRITQSSWYNVSISYDLILHAASHNVMMIFLLTNWWYAEYYLSVRAVWNCLFPPFLNGRQRWHLWHLAQLPPANLFPQDNHCTV